MTEEQIQELKRIAAEMKSWDFGEFQYMLDSWADEIEEVINLSKKEEGE